jgi:hypothetical protein
MAAVQHIPHTRVVSRTRVNTCSLAYDITQIVARRLLYELAIHRMSDTNDLMFRYVCDGMDGRTLGVCLTVKPQLFQHHRPRGSLSSFSDTPSHGDGFNDQVSTQNTQWGVCLNFEDIPERGKEGFIVDVKEDVGSLPKK